MSEPWAFPKTTDLEPLFAQIQNKDRIPRGILELLDNCSQNQKFAIGCSGGADSTFLTFLIISPTYYSHFHDSKRMNLIEMGPLKCTI